MLDTSRRRVVPVVGVLFVSCATAFRGTPELLVFVAEYERAEGLREIAIPDTGETLFVPEMPLIGTADVAGAQAVRDDYGQPAVKLWLAADAVSRIQAWSRQNIHKRLVFLLDDRVLMAPVLTKPITEDFTLISGIFTESEASQLAAALARK